VARGARDLLRRGFGSRWRAAVLIVEMHEMLEHLHEGAAFAGLQRREDRPLRRQHRGLDVADQPATERRDGQRLGPPIDGPVQTPDQFLFFQSPHHVADGRAVERDDMAQRRLIDPRMIVDRDQRGILYRRDVEFLRLIEKKREGNLLQPADEMAGHFEKATVLFRRLHVAGAVPHPSTAAYRV